MRQAYLIRETRIDACKKYGADFYQAGYAQGDCTPIDLKLAYALAFRQARKRRSYSLTADEEMRLVSDTKGRCSVTGIVFSLRRDKYFRAPFAPSLDRIDSGRPYELGNVRLVCVAANLAMNEWGEWVLAAIANGYVAKSLNDKSTANTANFGAIAI
jgi:hypothetical protein